MVGNMSATDNQMLRDLLNATLVARIAQHHGNFNQTMAMARMAAMSNNGGVTSQVSGWVLTGLSF